MLNWIHYLDLRSRTLLLVSNIVKCRCEGSIIGSIAEAKIFSDWWTSDGNWVVWTWWCSMYIFKVTSSSSCILQRVETKSVKCHEKNSEEKISFLLDVNKIFSPVSEHELVFSCSDNGKNNSTSTSIQPSLVPPMNNYPPLYSTNTTIG